MPVVEPSSFNLVLDPGEVASGRVQLFLNEFGILVDHAGVDWGDSLISAFMAEMAIGSTPVDYRLPNRMITIPLLVHDDDTEGGFELARSRLQQKIALIQMESGSLKRAAGLYADIVNATLTLPDVWGETGEIEPNVKLVLEALPDFYGDEVVLDSLTGTAGETIGVLAAAGVQAAIAGHLPGRVTVTVNDSSGHDQHALIWGFRSRYYDPAPTAALAYEAESMTPASGSAVTNVGTASGGKVVRYAGLTGNWVNVLATDLIVAGPLTHVGSYRIWVRAQADSTPDVRLIWAQGQLSLPEVNEFATVPGPNNSFLLDLGEVRLDPLAIGAHAWHGIFQARGAGQVDIDKVWLQPISEYAGRVVSFQSALLSGQIAPAAVYANRSLELAHNGAWGLGPDGSNWNVMPVIGDLPRVPVSNLEARPVELFVKTTRGDLMSQPDSAIDPLSVDVRYRPCYLFRA